MKKEREDNPSRVAEIEKFVLDAGSADLPTFGGTFLGGIYIQQYADEIAPAIDAILNSGRKIGAYLEIGVAAGGMTYLVNHFLHPDKIVLVDDGSHYQAGERGRILEGLRYTTLLGNSVDPAIITGASEASDGYDLLMIDGDHTYLGSRADADNYLPMLREGGFLIMHDTAFPGWGPMIVMDELKKDPGMEFIAEYVSEKPAKLGITCGVALFRKVTPHVSRAVRVVVSEEISYEDKEEVA
jgi:cephalosporin hydroxylase